MDLDPDPMDLMDLRLTGFGSRSNPSISYTAFTPLLNVKVSQGSVVGAAEIANGGIIELDSLYNINFQPIVVEMGVPKGENRIIELKNNKE